MLELNALQNFGFSSRTLFFLHAHLNIILSSTIISQMADSLPNIPVETIAMNWPARKINPPARLTDGNNSAITALSSHCQGIAAHAAAKAAISTPV